MDRALLTWFNQTLSHPLLDKLMLGATSGGLMLFPLSGIILWIRQKRKLASAIFIAQILALAVALIFQWLGQRARPDVVRLITAVPDYPSYPSVHAALVFSAAAILSWKFPLALLILLVIAVLEEGAQAFSPHRSVDAVDLACGVMGIIFFWKISEVLRTRAQASM